MEIISKFVWIYICILGLIYHVRSQVTAPTTAAPRKSLNITVIPNIPYYYESDDGTPTGFLPDVIEVLSDIADFDYHFHYPDDGRYGHMEDGNWSGMVQEVISGAADIAAALTVYSTRNEYVDFTVPVQSADPVIVLRRPSEPQENIQENLTKLLFPLEFAVWLMTVLAFLVTGTFLYIISHFNPYEWRRMAKDKEATLREAESFTCLNSFWFVISTLAWQGYVRAPRSMGGRITVTAWWFFVLIFLLSYTASLTNYLRVGPKRMTVEGYTRIQSFEDLSKNDGVDVGMVANGSTSHFFERSSLPGYHRLYQKYVEFGKKHGPIKGYNQGVEYLRDRPFLDFAMIMESPIARYEVHQQPCDLYMVSDSSSSKYIAMAVAKNSPLLAMLNEAMLKMFEDGSFMRIEKQWFEPKCEGAVYETHHETYKVPPFYKLDLGTFSGALLILLVGLVLGGFVSLIEFCLFKWAETHPDEEELTEKPVGNEDDLATSEQHLTLDTKKGGATPV